MEKISVLLESYSMLKGYARIPTLSTTETNNLYMSKIVEAIPNKKVYLNHTTYTKWIPESVDKDGCRRYYSPNFDNSLKIPMGTEEVWADVWIQ